MSLDPILIQTLRDAIAAHPDNVSLRKNLAGLLLGDQDYSGAETEFRQALLVAPEDPDILLGLASVYLKIERRSVAIVILEDLVKKSAAPPHLILAAESLLAEISGSVPPRVETLRKFPAPIVKNTTDGEELPDLDSDSEPDEVALPPQQNGPAVLRSTIRFEHVGGMGDVKEAISLKIIHPLKHPELYQAYGKKAGGGILLYGPPGCGKTFLARAAAGEIDAYFMPIGIHEVLDLYLGQSEKNLHEIFECARKHPPCVLFFDEVDALGARRSDMRVQAGRHVINQFLSEMDGSVASNDGVLLLGATNAPWHIDPAFRRPGRFDRIIFVPPPDPEARHAILRLMLSDRLIEPIDYEKIVRKTDCFSGADLKSVVDLATESRLKQAMKSGRAMPITQADLMEAAARVKPSTREWLASARNYILYANQDGMYDDVAKYLKV